ncbi:unnamed protein product [Lampetra fluviatilis]
MATPWRRLESRRRRGGGGGRDASCLPQRAAALRPSSCHLDSLALERSLSLAQELSVALSITEEDLSSLKVARCMQAHVALQQWPTLAACAGSLQMRRGTAGVAREVPLATWRSMTTCFKCGQPGHIARGCRNSTGLSTSPSMSSAPPTSASSASQASHDHQTLGISVVASDSHDAIPILGAVRGRRGMGGTVLRRAVEWIGAPCCGSCGEFIQWVEHSWLPGLPPLRRPRANPTWAERGAQPLLAPTLASLSRPLSPDPWS